MRTVFAGGLVFDGMGGPPAQADVAVEGERIVELGAGLDGDELVDVSGLTLLPGLFDTHVHVMFGHVDVWRFLQEPFSYRFYDAIRNLDATLAAGITSVRDAGGADLGVKQAVEEGIVRGPRLQISLTMLSQTGGHGDGWLPSGGAAELFPDYPGMPSQIVDGVDEARRKIRELVRNGADVIKIATSGGVLSPRDSPDQPGFSVEEIEVMVAEASAAGLWVMSHAQATIGIKNAVRAGVRSIEHGIYLDDEAIALMLEHDAYLVPTLVAPTGVLRAAEQGASIPENVLRKSAEVIEAHRDSFRRATEAGVKIAMGTDSGVTPHGENLRELELMAACGMPPADVLVSTTRIAAELMGVDRELGTIDVGKRADLVAVSGDAFDFADLRADRVRLPGRQARFGSRGARGGGARVSAPATCMVEPGLIVLATAATARATVWKRAHTYKAELAGLWNTSPWSVGGVANCRTSVKRDTVRECGQLQFRYREKARKTAGPFFESRWRRKTIRQTAQSVTSSPL